MGHSRVIGKRLNFAGCSVTAESSLKSLTQLTLGSPAPGSSVGGSSHPGHDVVVQTVDEMHEFHPEQAHPVDLLLDRFFSSLLIKQNPF